MGTYGMLVAYGQCGGCQACVDACRQAHHFSLKESGLMLSTTEPFQFPSGRTETYFVATPTAFCNGCGVEETPACAAACPAGCISIGELQHLGLQMAEKKMALFTLPDSPAKVWFKDL